MQLPDGRYILYRREWDAAAGKWQKIPCDGSGRTINAHDPSHWRTLAQVSPLATWDESRPTAPYGVAWVLNGDGWFFLDLDKCRDASGQWSAEAVAIWQSFRGALGEVSTSGNGLHIFGRCDPSQLADRRNKWAGWLEWYHTGRFVALSQAGPAPIGGKAADVDWTAQLLRFVPQREFLGELPEGRAPEYTGPDDDDALLSMALRSSNGAAAFGAGVTFADLWNGNVAALSQRYPAYDGGNGFDRSSADMALMSLLAFWTGKDMPRMDRLFRRSALMRPKYDEREDYRQATVGNAARLCRRVYDQPRKDSCPGNPAPAGRDASGATDRAEVLLTAPEMQRHFAGCVYIRDSHRVFVPDGSLLKPEQFNATYGGHMFAMLPDGTKPTRKAFEAFTESAAVRFPQAVATCFRPDRAGGEIIGNRVNIYVPPEVRRMAGDVTPFLDLLGRLLPNERDRLILLNYMAACVQHPGVKFQWAPVLQGCEGNGKTAIFSAVSYAVGKQYSYEPRAKHLGGNFNGWIEGKVFILVEEIHMEGRRDVLDALKPMITNTTIETERKGVDQRLIENVANWGFCTNYKDAVLKSRGDRRYAVFFTAQQTPEDLIRDGMGGDYFPRFWNWLRADGYAIVAQWLGEYALSDEFNPAGSCHRAPRTSSTDEAVAASTGGIEAEIIEATEAGAPGFQGGWVSVWHVMQLCEKARFRVARGTISKILTEMGYEVWGRAPRAIMQEGGTRPNLWRKRGAPVATFEDYLSTQMRAGYS